MTEGNAVEGGGGGVTQQEAMPVHLCQSLMGDGIIKFKEMKLDQVHLLGSYRQLFKTGTGDGKRRHPEVLEG